MKLLFISAGALSMCEKPSRQIEITLAVSTCYLHHQSPSNSWLGMKNDSYKIVGNRRLMHLPQKGKQQITLVMVIVAIRTNMPMQKINICHSARIYKVLSVCLNSQSCFGGQCLQKHTIYSYKMPSLNFHCYCFDVYSKKGMEINIFDLFSKHSIKMATAQKSDLQPDGSIE